MTPGFVALLVIWVSAKRYRQQPNYVIGPQPVSGPLPNKGDDK